AVQIGKKEELKEDEKPKFANLNPSQTIETITLEEALKLFSLPKDLGEYLSQPVSIGIGRFGPYVRHGEAFVSIPKTQDPMEMNLEMAIELIKEKQKSDAPIGTYKGLPISQGKGRFGPFLKWNGIFVNIPRKYNPDALSLDQAYELIEAKVDKEANRYIHKWDKEGIAVENGRWGPFIRFKKKNVAFPKIDGQRVTKESAAVMTLADVKEIIETALPGSFKK
ncbi:MAG: DNA topoisomerase I, partial [Saprospiraceae bacterium]